MSWAASLDTGSDALAIEPARSGPVILTVTGGLGATGRGGYAAGEDAVLRYLGRDMLEGLVIVR